MHAVTEDDAVEVGRAVARNNLVKTAFFGQDAELGPDPGRRRHRRTARRLRRRRDRRCHQRGLDLPRPARPATIGTASTSPAGRCTCIIDLHAGTETATILTNDLSHAYVHENSAYST